MKTTTTSYLIRIAQEYRAYVRNQAKAPSYVPITLTDGASAPELTGESGYYTTQGGKPVHYPNAYRRAWGKPVYHCSTIACTVGREWLAVHCIPEWTMCLIKGDELLVQAGACGIEGQAGRALGMSAERVVAEIGPSA